MNKPNRKQISMSIEPENKRVDLNQFLSGGSDNAMFVEIEGDGSEDVGIYNGDFIMLDRAGKPKENDVVVLSVGGEYVITRHKSEARRGLRLVTAKPLEVLETSQIYGVVTFIIKNVN